MEKNTILAFVLCLLVLIIWFIISSKQKERVPIGEEPQRREQTSRTEPSQKPVQQPSVLPETEQKEVNKDILPIKRGTEKVIPVETPFYKAVFSNVGPTIKSFKLKNYHTSADPDSPLVELVTMEKSLKPFLKLSFDQGPDTGNKDDIYHVEADQIILNRESAPRDLTFSTTTPTGVTITQTFRIYPDKYPINILVNISNPSPHDIEGNLKATLRNYPPENKKSYYSFIGLALLLDDELETIAVKKLKKEERNLTGLINWMSYESDYFMSAVIIDEQKRASVQGRFLPSGLLEAVYVSPSTILNAQQSLSNSFTIYLGPRDLTHLKPLGRKLESAINFGWTDVIAKPLLHALRFFNKFVKNYGLAIIILTILIKILFWPLTHKSYKSMKEMQKLQPLMAKIREKYKNNKEQMNKELMGLYKTYKVNPMGGCLPMLIQMPVFFALFRILGSSIELRHAPFFLWINDLSAPDRLFHFPFQIPFMSPPYGIPILTLLMGASMFIQQKMTPTPGDPSQAKIMMFLPIIFTFLFINFPSGLVLYWLTNNILSIGQQYRIKKSSA